MTPRDRHGRGLRGPLIPASLPGHVTRADAFADAVADAAGRLETTWGRTWGRVEFAVETVPPSNPAPWEDGVPLARLFPADQGQSARIVVYRRPLELRAQDADLHALIRDVLAENVAHLVGRRPDEVDRDYGTGA